MDRYADPAVIERLLAETRTWAVVGLSGDPGRAAYGVAAFLQRAGKHVIPVHPTARSVLGQRAYPTLADVPGHLDVVDVFRRPQASVEIARAAADVGAGALWLQLGVVNAEAAALAAAAGLDVVMDRCPKIEWAVHGPRAAG